ncbi:HAD family phosphatase [Caballeronia sp. J97]|uniref:HAD family hydrolase n=1 Tax=Caballeronia sp. J97 TaxID=2805429 RepID=UPI002AB207CC|nr:HAD family phosphatase [Caballeronia sp. J97]
MTSVTVSLVLFDMEGVLTHYDRDVRVAHLAASTNCSPESVRHAIWGSGLEARADAGIIDENEYLATLGAMLNHPVSKDEWLAARRASITPNEQTLALAGQLRSSCRMAILTNNCHLVTDHLDYLNPAVDRMFGNAVYSSASFGATKPAAQAYLRCVEEIGARPGETLFIDDTGANVQGAIDAGLIGYKFENAATLKREFERLGLL